MRKLSILAIALLICITGFSQPAAYEGKTEYQKGEKVAAILELPYPTEVVEDAIKSYMSKKGVKEDKSRGYSIYRNLKIREDDAEMTDMHFKVERKNRKEKDVSVVYLLVGRPSENMGVRTVDDRYKVDEAKEFLNSLVSSVEAHNLDVGIGEQSENVKKAEKRLKNLEDDQKDIERRIQGLQEKLEENKRDQQKQLEEITRQKTMLDTMQSRKKN